MTTPWRRSWEKGPPSRNGGIVLVAVFHVKAMNQVGDAFRARKAAQRPPSPAAWRKSNRLGGSFSRNRIHGGCRREHEHCGAMIGSGCNRIRPPRASMDFGGEERGGGKKIKAPAARRASRRQKREFLSIRPPPTRPLNSTLRPAMKGSKAANNVDVGFMRASLKKKKKESMTLSKTPTGHPAGNALRPLNDCPPPASRGAPGYFFPTRRQASKSRRFTCHGPSRAQNGFEKIKKSLAFSTGSAPAGAMRPLCDPVRPARFVATFAGLNLLRPKRTEKAARSNSEPRQA